MRGYEARQIVRNTARAYEQALDPAQRKRLGQFFTGVPLGKLLAHLALRPDIRTVLDPMVGHGDLLDATHEAAAERGISIARLDGIEIDKVTADTCRDRLAALIPKESAPYYSIVAADAFDPATLNALPVSSYDLVITNPPYVRYQTRSANDPDTDSVRAGLEQIVDSHHMGVDGTIWKVLTLRAIRALPTCPYRLGFLPVPWSAPAAGSLLSSRPLGVPVTTPMSSAICSCAASRLK